MKTKSIALVALATVLCLGGAALAGGKGEVVTLKGEVICAKCTLKVEGQSECQNVLRVAKEGAEPALYWIVSNEVSEAVGHVCGGVQPVKLVGTLAEKDGITWITPKEMKALETS